MTDMSDLTQTETGLVPASPEAAEAVDYVPFEATVAPGPAPAPHAELDRLRDVPVDLAVEIGRTTMTIGETLALGPGSTITLNRRAGESVDLLVTASPSRAARSWSSTRSSGCASPRSSAPRAARNRPPSRA